MPNIALIHCLYIASFIAAGLSAVPAQAQCSAAARGEAAVKSAVLEDDARALAALIDPTAMAVRASRGLAEDDALRQQIQRALERNVAPMAANLLKGLVHSGLELVVQEQAPTRAVFRKQAHSIGGRVDYFEFDLGPEGCIEDWHSLSLGTPGSELMRKTMLLSRRDDSSLSLLFGLEQIDPRYAETMRALAEAMHKNDRAASLKALDAIKISALNSFELSMLKVSLLASQPNSSEYRKALEALAEGYGDDDRSQFLLIDHFFIAQRYDRGLSAIARLQANVGIDEESELLRAAFLKLSGREEDAVVALRNVVRIGPTRDGGHRILVSTLAEYGRFEEAVEALQTGIEHGVAVDHETLRKQPDYADLLASPEYRAWRSRLRAD